MTLPRDLLDQAELLANKEPRKPKQASLRRAVSAAYYALFHLIIEVSANVLAPRAPAGLRRLVQRAFPQGQIKSACKDFVSADAALKKIPPRQTGLLDALESLIAFPLDPSLLFVLSAFIELQEARHKADYDLTEQWDRLDVLTKIGLARRAFLAWGAVRKSPNVATFMTCVAFRKEWGK
ncbi:MAG: hypothetical protein WAV18_32480 [Roseiarcus sp.]